MLSKIKESAFQFISFVVFGMIVVSGFTVFLLHLIAAILVFTQTFHLSLAMQILILLGSYGALWVSLSMVWRFGDELMDETLRLFPFKD